MKHYKVLVRSVSFAEYFSMISSDNAGVRGLRKAVVRRVYNPRNLNGVCTSVGIAVPQKALISN